MFPLYQGHSLALLTDLYELTMAYAYWKEKMQEQEAVFHLTFQKKPFNGGYTIAAGLESIIDYLQNFRFESSDLNYLSTLCTADQTQLFEKGFLDYLQGLKLQIDLDSVVEGEVVFPRQPILRVQGPIIQCQLLESALLNLTNFPSLIATKAARICSAAGNDEVIEFGLRRAQGIDGAMTASRAAYIGGCHATSNTLAGKLLQIPVKGTHAHSWVMAFDNELDSFRAYARAMPHNSIFLVDTYDSLQGVRHAIEIGKWLQKEGYPFLGIRLDSGDLAYLSIESRKLLDEAGFLDAKIVASNDLNETLIADLKQQGAKISVWGVGTNLVTGEGQGALQGVYKLSAIRHNVNTPWLYRLKLSERMTKISHPGILQVRRYWTEKHGYIADAIYDLHTEIAKGCNIIDPDDCTRRKKLGPEMNGRDLLIPVMRKGKCVYQIPSLHESRNYCRHELARFDRTIKRFCNPHIYPVGLEQGYYQKKLELIDHWKPIK